MGVRGRHGRKTTGLLPAHREASGNTITTWLTSLHIAAVGGVGYRVVATVLGLAVIVLSVTGVMVWWRKRGTARTTKPITTSR
ncbi:hypothetical protein HML84_12625 [Alcanivorax sp. IO_7]|nr:hypothetical protein HML84_12625 [Alcanivorax sp. IO_7]